MKRNVMLGVSLALAGAQSLAGGVSAQDATSPKAGGDGPHPAHIHAGVCPTPGDVVVPLTDVAGATEPT
jgi:hypothetical protein